MAYELVIMGRAEGALWAALTDRLGEASIHVDGGSLTLSIPDQPGLVAVLGQLNDLNITIERVEHIRSS